MRITSRLGVEYHDDLEDLLFFNPCQSRVRSRIAQAVEQFGLPAIREDGDLLRIELEHLGECQTLYAIDEQDEGEVLAGVIVFFRVPEDTLLLLHVAIGSDYAAGGDRSTEQLSLQLIRVLENVASCIRGVRRVAFQYAARVTPGKAEAASPGSVRTLGDRIAARAAQKS